MGFAHGLRDFGGTAEVCSGEVPSGWFLPSIHREGLATVLAAVEDGDADGRGDLAEVRSLAPIVAGSGHTSPLGPFRAELGETSIRSFTIGHLLGRHQSLETRPALDGRSARRSATLADAKRRVKRLSEEFSPRSAEAAGPYRTRTWWRRDREVLPAASVASST